MIRMGWREREESLSDMLYRERKTGRSGWVRQDSTSKTGNERIKNLREKEKKA